MFAPVSTFKGYNFENYGVYEGHTVSKVYMSDGMVIVKVGKMFCYVADEDETYELKELLDHIYPEFLKIKNKETF
jgi:hypothetical protein